MAELKEHESPKSEEHPEPAQHQVKNKKKFSPFLIGGVLVLLLIIGMGAFFVKGTLDKNTSTKASPKNTASTAKKTDALRARRAIITPQKAATLQIYTDNRVVVRLDIPAGALTKATDITFVPYVDAKNTLQVSISPSSLTFKKPVTLTFDLSRSTLRTDASKNVTTTTRTTGATQIVQISGSARIPQLIARSTETSTLTSARILSGGIYQVNLQPTDQIELARKTLAEKNIKSLPLLEAGSVLVFTNQSLTTKEKGIILAAAKKIIAIQNPSPYELFPAVLLKNKLEPSKTGFIPKAHAADISAGFYEFRCKDRSLSVEEYVVAAQTAQALGHEDIGEKCLDAAKNRVAEDAREVLQQANPSTSQIIKMMGRVQMFGLADLDVALQKKLDEVVNKKIEDVLNDPNASMTDLVKALQDAQVTGNDEKYGDTLNQRIQQEASRELNQVLNDPQSTMIDVAKATQKAQAVGLDTEADAGLKKLQDMSKRTAQEILDNPRSTAKELEIALGEAILNERDAQLRDEIKKRKKEAEQREALPTPTPSPKVGDDEENLEVGYDWSAVGLVFLEMAGLESFDENGIKKFVQDQTDKSNSLLDLAPELCAMAREFAGDIPELIQNCNYLEGEARQDVEKARQDGMRAAEEIGDIQSDEYEAPEYEMHWEIEITPTPDPDEEGYQVGEEYSDEEQPAGEIEVESSEPDDSMWVGEEE